MSRMHTATLCFECLVPVCNQAHLPTDLEQARPPPRQVVRPDAQLLPVHIDQCLELSSVVVQKAEEMVATLSTNDDARRDYLDKRSSVVAKFKTVPLLDKRKDIQCKAKLLLEFEKKLSDLEKERANHSLHMKPQSKGIIDIYHRKVDLETTINSLIAQINKKTSVINMEELKSRKRILRRLEFISDSDVLTTKGRVACEISSADAIVVTESLLSGAMSQLSGERLVSFLSCFVLEEDVKVTAEEEEDEEVAVEMTKVRALARHVSGVSRECRLAVWPEADEQAYAAAFKAGLAGPVRRWAQGTAFGDLRAGPAVYDGTIVRCLRRVDELLGQLQEAAKAIGNGDLDTRLGAASALIRRGIVFGASLYLTDSSNQSCIL